MSQGAFYNMRKDLQLNWFVTVLFSGTQAGQLPGDRLETSSTPRSSKFSNLIGIKIVQPSSWNPNSRPDD